ncbi:alpha/beta hydrolase [Sinimarinibacterium flocculans]|uniref:TAP-like protein n=1 Tax=Sinimarinibacterium flocculans TaxID=985250 RepID=A0A318EIT2_9GAMM|nr:alpha/beta hydrolase [Sinimarinibacterium flocculans]PXV71071.1 TAP-like protein [Sinimarinibacterium flocculans]
MMRLLVAAALLWAMPLPAARAQGPLTFADCDLVDGHGVPRVEAQCADFAVPENHDEPQGRQIELRVVRVEARQARRHDDPVVLLAGGPGQSAVDAYVSMRAAFAPLNRDREVLLVDQRGTGSSNRLACDLAESELQLTPEPAELRRMANRCLDDLAGRANVRYYTTSDYILDLEQVRSALGIAQLNLIGGSYGTRVALEYLRRHPQAIRTVVVDGVVPPTLALTQDHARNLDDAIERLFATCAADAGCRERYGRPAQLLRQLRERLARAPMATGYPDPVDFTLQQGELTRGTLAGIVRLFSYQPESASLLPLLLAEAGQGRPQALVAQFGMLLRTLGDKLAHGMELTVTCTEDLPFLGPQAEDDGTLLGSMLTEAVIAQCDVWPRGRLPEDFKRPLRSDKPVLILSGEFDPVTPPRYGDEIAQTLSSSRRIVAPGQGHIVMPRGCLPRLVSEFIDTADAAGLDPGCVDSLGTMPFFLDYNGFAP